MNKQISAMLDRLPGFVGGGPGAVLWSSVSVRRNLANHRFTAAADAPELENIRRQAGYAASRTGVFGAGDTARLVPAELDSAERALLYERRLVPAEFLKRACTSVWASGDGRSALLINGEDHLEIKVMSPGEKLDELRRGADSLDSALAEYLDFAFDSKFGYLSASPAHLGTGMHAAVMMHLPGLVAAEEISAVLQGAAKLGFPVCGVAGDTKEYSGALFRFSNQSTLGESETDIIGKLKTLVATVEDCEKRVRAKLAEKDAEIIPDLVWRAWGLLRHCRKISFTEALGAISGLRLGADTGLLRNLNAETPGKLFAAAGNAYLHLSTGCGQTQCEFDAARARMLRRLLF